MVLCLAFARFGSILVSVHTLLSCTCSCVSPSFRFSVSVFSLNRDCTGIIGTGVPALEQGLHGTRTGVPRLEQGLGLQSLARGWDCLGLWDCSPEAAKGLALQYQTILRDCNPQSGTVCILGVRFQEKGDEWED